MFTSLNVMSVVYNLQVFFHKNVVKPLFTVSFISIFYEWEMKLNKFIENLKKVTISLKIYLKM